MLNGSSLIKSDEENIQETQVKSRLQHHILPLRPVDPEKQPHMSPCQVPTEIPAAPC